MTMKILVTPNQKGGATKTTTAAHLAAGAALRGVRTVLCDLDGQCNLTELFGLSTDQLREEKKFSALDLVLGRKTATEALVEFPERFDGNLRLIPGHPSMSKAGTNIELAVAKEALDEDFSPLEAEERKDATRLNLREAFQPLEGEVDLVVCDPPPSLGFELVSALAAADAYVVPCTPNKYDLSGYKRLNETVALAKRRYNPKLEFLGIVLSRVRKATKLHTQTVELLESRFGNDLLRPYISECIRFGECPYHAQTIYELVPNDPASKDLFAVTDVVLERLFGREFVAELQPVDRAGLEERVVLLEPPQPSEPTEEDVTDLEPVDEAVNG